MNQNTQYQPYEPNAPPLYQEVGGNSSQQVYTSNTFVSTTPQQVFVPIYSNAPSVVMAPNPHVVMTQTPVVYMQTNTPLTGSHMGDVYNTIKSRTYVAPITFWIEEGWRFFKLNPCFHICWTLIFMGFCMIPYIGAFIGVFYYMGIIQVIKDVVKYNGMGIGFEPRAVDGFNGFRLFCPLLALFLLQLLIYIAGLICLVIFYIYLTIAMNFAPIVYLEYHRYGISIWQSIKLSIHLVNKNFCAIFGFLILLYLIEMLGIICIFFGLLVAIPVIVTAHVVAFRDMFGFYESNFGGSVVV